MDWNPQPMMSYGTFLALFLSALIVGSGVVELIGKFRDKEWFYGGKTKVR